MRIELGGTDWADIKHVSELRRSDRRILNRAISYEIAPGTNTPIVRASLDDDMANAVLAVVVTDWSLALPLPSRDIASLDNLTLEQDDLLRAAIQPHIDALQGKNAPTKDNADPTTVSAPSSVS